MAEETKPKQLVFSTLNEAKESGNYDVASPSKLYTVATKDGNKKRVVIASNPSIAYGLFAIDVGCTCELAERKPLDKSKRAKTQFANLLSGLTSDQQAELIKLVTAQANAPKDEEATEEDETEAEPESAEEPEPEPIPEPKPTAKGKLGRRAA